MRSSSFLLAFVVAGSGVFLLPALAQAPVTTLTPTFATQPVANDPDDPALWVNPRYSRFSRILGTNKVSAKEGGALYVFDLNGRVEQIVRNIDRPNNVDVEYGFRWKKQDIDIAVVTERNTSKIRLFRIFRTTGMLSEIVPGGLPVFAGQNLAALTDEQKKDFAAPMGIALYKRPKDGVIFVIVGRKSGPETGYLWQYRLKDDGKGNVTLEKVREFGTYSGKKEIESIAVDDEWGYVYYSDEGVGVRKYYADPDTPNAAQELALFASDNFQGDHEGIAIYPTGPRKGYVICTDQIPKANGGSIFRVFKREGEPGDPHRHTEIARFNGGTDETDGIEATAANLGVKFPKGALITMNSGQKNFLVFDMRKVRNGVAGRRNP